MKKKALWKDFLMEIKTSYNRFLSIFLIVALGVAFFAGIRATDPDMRITADSYYDRNHLMDIRILSSMGFTDGDVSAISKVNGVKTAEPEYSQDVLCKADGNEMVLHTISLTRHLNLYTVEKGRLPAKADEVFVDSHFITATGYQIGDKISLYSGTDQKLSKTMKKNRFTIVGIGSTPYYLSFQRGSSNIGNGKISSFIVVLPEVFQMKAYTAVYASVSGAKEMTAYTDQYDKAVKKVVGNIKKITGERCQKRYDDIYQKAYDKIETAKLNHIKKPVWYVLNRKSVDAYIEFEQNADRIGAIGEVFPAIFFLVAALISLTTMTRMVEEERTQIGTLKALGYSKKSIAMKYILYALSATLGGSLFGATVGLKVLPTIIITAYKMLYPGIPRVITPFNTYYAALATVLSVFCVGLATFLACYKELLAKPAELMRPETPKTGRRVVLERLPFLWNHLNFTWKATVRNLMRYKKRFFMTIFGIGGCMALLLVGFGLKDSIFVIYTRQFDDIMVYDAEVSLENHAAGQEIKELEKGISSNPDITSSMAMRSSSVDISCNGKTKNVTMIVPKNPKQLKDYIVLRKRVGHQQYTLDDNGIILTEQIAKKLGAVPGDTITVKEGSRKVRVKVSEITENYMTHYLYMTPSLYRHSFGKQVKYNEYYLLMPGLSETAQLKVGNSLLKLPTANGVFYTSYYQNLLSHILVSLNIVVWVLIISAGALAFVVLYNLNNININERRRELATIKVLGFYNNELAAYVFRENVILTIIGTVFGIFFGILLHRYVIVTVEIDLVMFGRNINPPSYIYSVLLTFLFSAIVNLVMFFKLKKINMVESLKSVE